MEPEIDIEKDDYHSETQFMTRQLKVEN